MSYKTKVCQRCGKEYQPASGTQKYCPECGLVAKVEKHRESGAEYRKTHPENNANWRNANPLRVKANDAKRYWENPEKSRANATKYQKANPEKVKAKIAKWKKENPEKLAVSGSKRRAAKYANTPINEMLTSTEWLVILAVANGHCAYCGREAKLTLDHVIPLSKGGKHSADNVVPACKHCNYSKGSKTLAEWLGQQVSA